MADDGVFPTDEDAPPDTPGPRQGGPGRGRRKGGSRRPWERDEPDPFPPDPDQNQIEFTPGDYLAATTAEYRGLAEDIAKEGEIEHPPQAVAATIPGVGTGLIGFEDVTGERGISELDVEAEEQARTSDLALRVGSALVLATLFLGGLVLGSWWFTLFVLAVMLVALGEVYATLRRARYVPVALLGFAGMAGIVVGAHVSGPQAVAGFLAGTVVAVGLFYTLAVRKRPLENAAMTVLPVAWISLLSFAVMIGRSESSVVLVLSMVAVAVLYDVGAYFVGRGMGRRPLAPVLSPQKTLEGMIGGVVVAFAVALLLAFLPIFKPFEITGALWLAGSVSVLAPLGDAAESMLKRSLGVKDMGSILPGHGGMVDRIDALLFVVPAAYFLFRSLGYL